VRRPEPRAREESPGSSGYRRGQLRDADAAAVEQAIHRRVECTAPADLGEDRRRHADNAALLTSHLENGSCTFGERAPFPCSVQPLLARARPKPKD